MVSAGQIGIGAFALSGGATFTGGTNDVTINVADNATITGIASFGVEAYDSGVGNVSVTTGNGDIINGGSDGILAVSVASSVSAGHTVTVNAGADTIHSSGRYGINAGYNPSSLNSVSNTVHGDVSVSSNATITSANNGINALGTGNVTVATGASSSITSSGANGIAANALNGGSVSVTNDGFATGTSSLFAKAVGSGNIIIENDGTVTSTSFAGISVNQNTAGATGSTTIKNIGTVTAAGSSAAIFVAENAVGSVTINNSGIIGPNTVTTSTSAIGTSGASQVTINNSGTIEGHVVTGANGVIGANTIFNNTAGAVWQTSYFNDDGTIVAADAAIATTNVGNGGVVGYSGNGSLTLEAGASFTGDFLNIGELAGSSGTVLVTGAGTTVNTTSGQYQNTLAGHDGHASLTIADHAVVTTTGMGVAFDYQAGITDTLVIDNATLNVAQGLTLAFAGAVNATVENSGDIETNFLPLAGQAGGAASLAVTGANSLVTSSYLSLGPGSTSIHIGNGGSIDVGADATTIAHAIHIGANGSLVGAGVVDAAVINDGNITAAGGTLHFDQELDGGGTTQINAGTTLELAAGASSTQTV